VSKKTDILNTPVDKQTNTGRPVSNGGGQKSDKYQQWMTANGFDKETILKEFEDSKTGIDMIDVIKRRVMGVEFAAKLNEVTSAFYNDSNKQALALNEQLKRIEGQLNQYEFEKTQTNPEWSPIGDKQFLKWTEVKIKLINDIRKYQMELGKMSMNKDEMKDDDVDWEQLGEMI